MIERRIYEDEGAVQELDPDESPIIATKLYTQPYDLVILRDSIESLIK